MPTTNATWNERALADLKAEASGRALHIVGGRVRDLAAEIAPRQRPGTKPPGRGSFPREHPGYLAGHISEDYGTSVEGLAYVDIGGSTPESTALIRYRGGTGGVGAYGGSRGRDPFLVRALDAQIGVPL